MSSTYSLPPLTPCLVLRDFFDLVSRYLNRTIDTDEAQKHPHPASVGHCFIKKPHQLFERTGGKPDNASFFQSVAQLYGVFSF